MTLTTARDKYIQFKRGQGLAPGSQRNLQRFIGGFINFLAFTCGSTNVTLMHAERIREYLQDREHKVSRHTLRLTSILLRGFAAWGAVQRLWPAERVEGLEIIKAPRLLPRPYRAVDRDGMMAVSVTGPDALCRALLYHGALRNAETRGVRLKDVTPPYQLPNGEMLMGRLYVFGKGSKERVVDIHPALWQLIAAHLSALPKDTPLTRTLLAKPDGTPWTEAMVQRRARQWGKAVGLEGATPHAWRHTFASNALEITDDLVSLQAFLGHANIATTQGYTGAVDRKKAALARSVPTFAVSLLGMPSRPADAGEGSTIAAENAGSP